MAHSRPEAFGALARKLTPISIPSHDAWTRVPLGPCVPCEFLFSSHESLVSVGNDKLSLLVRYQVCQTCSTGDPDTRKSGSEQLLPWSIPAQNSILLDRELPVVEIRKSHASSRTRIVDRSHSQYEGTITCTEKQPL